MKTIFTILMTALALCACHHDDRNRSFRRDSTNRYEQRNDDTDRRHRMRRESSPSGDNRETLPYLPPFVMHRDAPAWLS